MISKTTRLCNDSNGKPVNPNNDWKATVSSDRGGNASTASILVSILAIAMSGNTYLRNKQSSEEGGEARFWGCSSPVGKGVTGAFPCPACQQMFGWLSACWIPGTFWGCRGALHLNWPKKHQNKWISNGLSELTCRRCGISHSQELDVSCSVVDTPFISRIVQVYKSIRLRRINRYNSKKAWEKETAHLAQVREPQ